MPLATFRLYLSAGSAAGSIVINDEDVSSRVDEVQVRMSAGGVPELWLKMLSEGTLEGEGVVQVVQDASVDPVAVIIDFLSRIDPAQWEKDSLDSIGMGDSGTDAMLEQLKKYATGA